MPDLMAMVADLIGAHGRVEIAFRTAADAPPRRPQDRWQPVLQELHAAVGLVSSLAAGSPTRRPGTRTRPCRSHVADAWARPPCASTAGRGTTRAGCARAAR